MVVDWRWISWRKRLGSGQKAFLKFGLPMVVRKLLTKQLIVCERGCI